MISVELTGRFKKIVRQAGREEEVSAALKLVIEGFGNPHAHTGLAIRKLGAECSNVSRPFGRDSDLAL